MRDFYDVLNGIIMEEIDNSHNIVIYPMGKVGTFAKYLLNNRYNVEGIYIDNNLCKYNPQIISLNEYKKRMSEDDTIILCAESKILNIELRYTLSDVIEALRVRDFLEPVVHTYLHKEDYFCQIKELLKVKKVIDYNLVRAGGAHDGGYVMVDDIRQDDVVYSFGIGDNITFDEWISGQCRKVLCFDHTVEKLPKDSEKLHFIKIGISAKDDLENCLLSLKTILMCNGDDENENLILKMDVEGAEWDSFEDVTSETLCLFRQMTFELHELTNLEKKEKTLSALKKINKTHQVVWIHANNSLGVEKGDVTIIPPLLEITYVRKKDYEFEDIHYCAPIEIDEPNDNSMFDAMLFNWGSADYKN